SHQRFCICKSEGGIGQQFRHANLFQSLPGGSVWHGEHDPMRRAPLTWGADLSRWARHFGDFVAIPLAILVFAGLGGLSRKPLVVVGLAAWTLAEYLIHRFVFHQFPLGRRLHQLHHDRPADPDAERSSLSTPLVASPFGVVLLGAFGLEDGSAIFAGLLAGYLIFIAVHHA